MTSKTVVYLHGLNSTGASQKATWLRRAFAPVPVLAPTYPAYDAVHAMNELRVYLQRLAQPAGTRFLFIGSSMGGFYAQALAPEFRAALVLINPALNPDELLAANLGPHRVEPTGEVYELTKAHLDGYKKFRLVHCDANVPSLLLLDKNDETIDYRYAQSFYAACGKTLAFEGGSHRFEHMDESFPDIRKLYDAL